MSNRRLDRVGVPDPLRIGLLESDLDSIENVMKEGFDELKKSQDQSRQVQIGILMVLITVLIGLAANLAFAVR